ncbi:MAG: HlyC/CorC family transporter [Phormidesmis sp. RL_2_1]|nr:HlyC/CorC family transporter [Phormidesmis sp. RL_2_1]
MHLLASPLSLLLLAPSSLTWPDVIARISAVIALIGLNAFFVTVEFSIVSVRRSRINQLVSTGDIQAQTVQKLQHQLSSLLSTTQLGITLSSLALGWIGEHTMAALIRHWITWLPVSVSVAQFLSHSVALPIAFLLLAYLQIVLGELCPKSVALLYPEKIARVLGPSSLTIARLLNPFVWLLNQSTRLLLSLAGIQENNTNHYDRVTPEELRLLITTATEIPDLQKEEREILSNVFEFRGATVEEIMVPRTSIAALPRTATFQDLLNEIVISGHSRYPITGESLDNILGIIHFNDLAIPLSTGELQPHTPIEPWILPARVVPETLLLNELLSQMQRSAREMVIVVDDYGGTAGLVTLRDLAAEIIGDIDDTSPEAQIIQKDSHTVIFPAQTDLEDVNQRLSLALPTSDDYLTLGGFVIAELQKIPQVNEQLIYSHLGQTLEFTVIAAEGPKLNKIQIYRPSQELTVINAFAPATVRKATDKGPSLPTKGATKGLAKGPTQRISQQPQTQRL